MFQFTPAHDGRRRAAHAHRQRVVSIHARARRATIGGGAVFFALAFQFTPAHDGRLSVVVDQRLPIGFNSRPRTTGDDDRGARRVAINVSIHARARRATLLPVRFGRARVFQFTPAHDGRLQRSRLQRLRISVSIHARARRATPTPMAPPTISTFQFTPAHDGRPAPCPRQAQPSCFNSRPRTTGDGVRHARP